MVLLKLYFFEKILPRVYTCYILGTILQICIASSFEGLQNGIALNSIKLLLALGFL